MNILIKNQETKALMYIIVKNYKANPNIFHKIEFKSKNN